MKSYAQVAPPTGRDMIHEQTIEQIGRPTLMAVGARNLTRGDSFLTFKVGRGLRAVTINLDYNDTYTVTTRILRTGREVYRQSDVYAEDLSEAVYQAHLGS